MKFPIHFKRKRLAATAGGVVLLFLLLRTCFSGNGAGPAAALYTSVEQGDLVVSVRASGEILSRDANKIIPRIKRSVVVSFLVPEGTRVAKDEVIARFSADEIDQRINEAEASLADRELAVVTARTDLEIQELDNANTLQLAEQAVNDAELEWKKFLEGDEPMDLRAAELKISTTASKRERTIKKHEEAKALLEEGFITEDQVEEDRIAMETAAVEAETARQELEILKNYNLPLKRNTAASKLDKAKTELEKTVKKNDVQVQSKRQALENAVRARDRAAIELETLRSDREAYDVKAPIDGVVNYGDPSNPWRRNDIQAGMTLNPGEVLVTIPNMTAMQANINVPEADVDNVQAGQSATIYVEAMGRRTFSGEVVRASEVANPGGWMSSDVKEFRVEISIPSGNGLRPGFTCDAEIIVDNIRDTLMLPLQAVFRDGETWFVYKGSSARAKKVPVKIGRVSVTHAQILEGLKKGDRVLLMPPEEES